MAILFINSIQYACLPQMPEEGHGNCIHTCPGGRVIEEVIPKLAHEWCTKKYQAKCECSKLTPFFEKFMRHISYDEVLDRIEQKCNE
jgi:hypothetical protein